MPIARTPIDFTSNRNFFFYSILNCYREMHAHACRAAMTSAENPVWSGQIVAVFDDVPLVGLRMQLPSTIDEIPMQTDTAAVTPF